MIDTTENYLIWENLEPITWDIRKRSGNESISVTSAKRRAPTFKELSASNGAYTSQDLVWLLPAVLLPTDTAKRPKPGDEIRDAEGTTWRVLEAAWNHLKSTWRLVTRNLILALDLRDQINIERAAITFDASGGQIATWPTSGGSTLYSNLAAKVQPITRDMAIVLGVEGFKGNYSVVVSQDVDLTGSYERVKWGSIYLEILKVRQPERIDQLPILDCMTDPY